MGDQKAICNGLPPPSEDGEATELILMDEWVQELRIAQEEARKLILANIESEQQDRVESMPHWSRMWEAGNQVILRADRKGKGRSKKLSKKWMGPYTIIEAHSPQVMVLEEPNSRNQFMVNFERIKPFNPATLTTLNSSPNEGHCKVEEVLLPLTASLTGVSCGGGGGMGSVNTSTYGTGGTRAFPGQDGTIYEISNSGEQSGNGGLNNLGQPPLLDSASGMGGAGGGPLAGYGVGSSTSTTTGATNLALEEEEHLVEQQTN